jgi:hypothetical protein
MSAKRAAPGVTKATTVVANDPDDLKGALKFIGGSRSDSWNNIPANQAVETLWLKNSDKAARDGSTVQLSPLWPASGQETSWKGCSRVSCWPHTMPRWSATGAR